jgi:hypothetical protein
MKSICCFLFFISCLNVWGQKIDVIILDQYSGDPDSSLFEGDRTFYGVYYLNNDNDFLISRFEGKEILRKEGAMGDYKTIEPVNGIIPEFIFSGIGTKQDTIKGLKELRLIYPGECVRFDMENKYYLLYANGNVIKSKDGIHPFSEIENYSLTLEVINIDSLPLSKRKQTLYYRTLKTWPMGGYENGIYIHWIGDLNGDGELDILLNESNHFACTDLIFLMSGRDPKKLVKKVSTNTICGC